MELDENLFKTNSELFYKGNSIYALQYPHFSQSSVSYDVLTNINENDLFHLYCTDKGSSGSPILNLENKKVICIHKEGSINFEFNIGTFAKNPILDFIEFCENKNNMKIMENNNYLSQSHYEN